MSYVQSKLIQVCLCGKRNTFNIQNVINVCVNEMSYLFKPLHLTSDSLNKRRKHNFKCVIFYVFALAKIMRGKEEEEYGSRTNCL